MRLKIGKDGKYLNLFPDTSLQLDIISPLYFGDRSPGFLPNVKSYSFTIPNDAHNRSVLNRPELLDNPEDFLVEEGWQVSYSGYIILSGRLEMKDTTRSGAYKVTIIGGIGGNLYDLKEIYLNQLDLSQQHLGEDDNTVLNTITGITQAPDDSDFLFPTVRVAEDAGLETPEFEEGEPEPDPVPTRYKYANRYRGGTHVREEIQYGNPVYSTFIPMLRLRRLIENALSQVGYQMAGVFSSHEHAEELSDLIVFNTRTLDQDDNLSPGTEYEEISLMTEVDLRQHVPELKCNDLIREVCNTFCWAPFVDPLSQVVTLTPMKDILTNQSFLDWTDKVFPEYIKSRKLKDVPVSFQYDHTGDDGYAELVDTDQHRYASKFFQTYDEADANLTIADIGAVVYIEAYNEYYKLLGFRPPSNIPLLRGLGKNLGYINDQEEPVFIPDTDSLLMWTQSNAEAGWSGFEFPGRESLPVFYGSLITPWYEDGEQIDKIVLLFYRGLQPDGNDELYPLASSSSYNYASEQVGNLSLHWNGESGLYNVWWKAWHEAILRMRPVTYPTRMDERDLANLDFSKKIRIDKHLYFLKRVKITINANSINPASVEYMQIN